MAEYDVRIGQELPKEVWIGVYKRLDFLRVHGARFMQIINYEGQGEQDAIDWENDIVLAMQAVLHVAEFARDRVRIVPIPDGPGGKKRKKKRK